MPPIKAAKKAAKKAAGHDPHKTAKDTRRAYEHLWRVQVLLNLQGSGTKDRVEQIIRLAQEALQAQQPKEAADLLRAAEHLSFGSLHHAEGPDETISKELVTAIHDEIDHQREKAKDHGDAKSSATLIQDLYHFLSDLASKAVKSKRYRAALEFSRGAEALTHLDHLAARELTSGPSAKRLSE